MRNSNNADTSPLSIGRSDETGRKIVINLKTERIVKCAVCALLGFATLFADMRPFSLSFYAAMFSADSWGWLFVSGVAGLFMADASSAWVYAAAMVMVTVGLALLERHDSPVKRCVVSGVFFTLFKLVRMVSDEVSAFAVMAVLLELIILEGSVVISYYGYSVFANPGKRRFVSSFEKICTFVFTAFVILAFGNLEIYERINLSSVAAVLYIYILCSGAGVENATVFGTIMGVITAMSVHPSADVAGMYAFGALVASLFSKYKKTGVVFGFVLASTAFSLLISDYGRIYTGIAESLAASLIYVVLPDGLIQRLSSFYAGTGVSYDNSALRQRVRKDDFSSLRKMSSSFRELSEIYCKSARNKSFGKGYVVSKMNTVSNKVCAFCTNHSKCFDCETERGMKNALQLFDKSLRNGRLNQTDLPLPMKEICHRKDSFAEAFNSMMEIVHTEKNWLGKINESRRLIGDQLMSVAVAIDKVCEDERMRLNLSLEENLRAALDKCGVFALGVSAYTDSGGDFNIYVTFKEGYVPPDAKNKIIHCIDNAVYTKSRFVSATSDGSEKIFLFCPQRKYTASFGYASKAKHGEQVSGDSFNVITPDKKSVVMALSDGMGYGSKARAESQTAIKLLEKFLSAGFDSDTAVRLINSSLLLKSTRDSFATIDICTLNLSDHCLIFTKLGAANAYIRTSGGVSVIRGRNLPAGILKEIEIEKHMLPIDSDTVIVMVSDGVGDTAIRTNENEDWIKKELLTLDTANPQIIAARILKHAYELEHKHPDDDMTVLAACITATGQEVYSAKTGT